MSDAQYDVVGLGNAIVDVLGYADDAFLEQHDLTKGTMALIDEARAESLYAAMGPSQECSGGSVANTLAGLASLGGKGAFIGKVHDDQLGTIFRHDLRSVGVTFDTPASKMGKATARCLIFVTPEGQRTMNTFLGACSEVSSADIDEETIEQSAVTYAEGYLWDSPSAHDAITKACEIAHRHDRMTAFTLSDPLCVDRHRNDFLSLISDHVDILFANEKEIEALFQTEDFDEATSMIRGKCEVAVLTRSEHGSLIVQRDGDPVYVEAEKIDNVEDTTGAGDLYASGFLYGYVRDYGLENSARLGTRCASEIITQLGARPMKPLKRLVA